MIGLKRKWVGKSTEELLESRRRQNARNRIPALRDDEFDISRTEVMGFPVLKLFPETPLRNALTAGWISIGNLQFDWIRRRG